MALGKMIYKNFKFPYNPNTSGFECDRSYVRHKYPQFAGNELEDFGPNSIVLTGSGEFFGENAYAYWNNLLVEFNKGGVGKVYHPVYNTVTRGLMVKLKSNLEPTQDYISYSFEIVADSDPNTDQDKAIVMEIKKNSYDISNISIGDIVNFTGNRHYTSSTSNSSSTCKPGRAKVTIINSGSPHPYHLVKVNGGGSTVYGWVNASDISSKVESTSDTQNKIVHTVVSGDCLSKICAYYANKNGVSINWKNVATYNNIKDPNSIRIGQKITIIW